MKPPASESPGPEWRRVATDPPSGVVTLRLPVDMTDGTRTWQTTTSQIPTEDDCPLWWRLRQGEL